MLKLKKKTMKKLWQNYTVKINCKNCGKEKDAYIHNVRKGYGVYCSRSCRNSFVKSGFQPGHGLLAVRKTPGDTGGREYQRLHRWVRKMLGCPEKCEYCQKDGLKSRHIHWASKSRLYKWDLTDWLRLCVPCHRNYDYARNN